MSLPTYAIIMLAIGAFALSILIVAALAFYFVLPRRAIAILPLHQGDVAAVQARSSFFFHTVVEPFTEFFDFSPNYPSFDLEEVIVSSPTSSTLSVASTASHAGSVSIPSIPSPPSTHIPVSHRTSRKWPTSVTSIDYEYSIRSLSPVPSHASAHYGDCEAVSEGAWRASDSVSEDLPRPAPVYMERTGSWCVDRIDVEHFDAMCNRPLRQSRLPETYDERQVRHAIGRKQLDWDTVEQILNYKPARVSCSSSGSSVLTFEDPAQGDVKRPYAIRSESWNPTRDGVRYWDAVSSRRRRASVRYGDVSRQEVIKILELKSKDVQWGVVRDILNYDPPSRNWIQRKACMRGKEDAPPTAKQIN